MENQGQENEETPHTAREIRDIQADNLSILESWTLKQLRKEWESWAPERLKKHWNLMKPCLPWVASMAKRHWRYEMLTKKLGLLRQIHDTNARAPAEEVTQK